MKDQWVLRHEGKAVYNGTTLECVEWIHKNHSYSLLYALRYAGYTMTKEATV